MAETNSDTTVDDDDTQVTEDDLRALKYPEDGVETSEEEDEPDEGEEDEAADEEAGDDDGKADDEAEDEEEQSESDFVKEFDWVKGDTPAEYAKNLELAYKNSSTEALRLKDELKAVSTTPATAKVSTEDEDEVAAAVSPLELYAKQQMDKSITEAFKTFQSDYPQVADKPNYDQFTRRVAILSKSILEDEQRLAEPNELYGLAALSLGWEKHNSPDSKDKLGMALKDKAAVSKTTSAPGSKPKASPVSEAMIKVNMNMYPGKSRDEIIKELTPHIQ